jgi:hypothetical protein
MTADLAALEAAATVAPWFVRLVHLDDEPDGAYVNVHSEGIDWDEAVAQEVTSADAALIVALRNAAPDLIAAARRAETAEAGMLALREALIDVSLYARADGSPCWCGGNEGFHEQWCDFTHDTFTDTAAAAQATEARIRADERERIAEAMWRLDADRNHATSLVSAFATRADENEDRGWHAAIDAVLAILTPAPEEAITVDEAGVAEMIAHESRGWSPDA